MAREIEIKLRIEDVSAFRRALKGLGVRAVSTKARRVHEWNELFDTPGNELKRREQLLRIRTESAGQFGETERRSSRGQKVILTFKRPIAGRPVAGRTEKYKVREEIEVEVADAQSLGDVLIGMGMRVWFRYEKYRTTFRLPTSQHWARGLCIELDETPMGSFLELEGPHKAIDRAAKALGYRKQDYVTANYFVLYRAHCRSKGKKLGDMLFKNANRSD